MTALIDKLPLLGQKLFFALTGLAGIGFIIGFHELGHFLFCKLFNIKTPSFSIGFGPRLITKKIGDTEFALSAIPLGGYVEIAGAAEVGQGDQDYAQATDEQSFVRKPWYQKMLVMLGGIGFNLIFAYAVFWLLYLVGMPKTPVAYPHNGTPVIAAVVADSPAFKAGIAQGDELIAVNGEPVPRITAFLERVTSSPHATFTLTLKAPDGTQKSVTVTTEEKGSAAAQKKIGFLGVVFEMTGLAPQTLLEALMSGVRTTHAIITSTVYAFSHILSKRDVSQMGGPIAIISETMHGVGKGFKIFILFLAIISINLAILNLIPVPILDGGQILFYTIEALIGRSLPLAIRHGIHIVSWLAFMLFALYLSVKDIARIAHPLIEHLARFFGIGG